MKNLHMSKLIELARTAAYDPENLREDGSVIWDFVSSDLHIDTDQPSDRIEKAIEKAARQMEAAKQMEQPKPKSINITITQKGDLFEVSIGDKGWGTGINSDLQQAIDSLTDYAADIEGEMK